MAHDSSELKNQEFWVTWLAAFKESLENAIAAEIGYGLDRFRGGASLRVVAKRQIQKLVDQKYALSDFRNSFLSLCKKHGILNDTGNRWSIKIDGPPGRITRICENLVNTLDTCHGEIETGLTQVYQEFGKQRRHRVPSEVAFQIVRLLEAHRDNNSEAKVLSRMFKPTGELNQLVCDIRDRHIENTIGKLEKVIAATEQRLKQATNPHEIRKIESSIKAIRKQIKSITKFEVRWNPFDVVREWDHNWINRLKTQMINSILSEEEPTIVKRLSPNHRERKYELMRAVSVGKYTNPRMSKKAKAQLAQMLKMFQSLELD